MIRVDVYVNHYLFKTVRFAGMDILGVFNSITQQLEENKKTKFTFSTVVYEDIRMMSLSIQSDHPKEAEEEICRIIKNVKILLTVKRKTMKLSSKTTFDFKEETTRYTKWDSELGRYICESTEYNKCKKCMEGAPYPHCCELECNEHEFCRGCTFMENRTGLRKIVQFGKIEHVATLPNDEQMFLWKVPTGLTQTEREHVIATAKSITQYGKVIFIPEKLGNLESTTRKLLLASLKSVVEKLEKGE